jgi:hypothetical protein
VLAGDLEPRDELRVQRPAGAERRDEIPAVGIVQGDEEVPLAGKMPVERAGGQAGLARDVRESGAGVATLGKRLPARREQGVAGGQRLGVKDRGDDKLPSGFHVATNHLLT